ncbi:two component sensor histidine kinase (plasmid) [Ketogulonicigenium robustum]|uniref:Two component sensor histidine kinase n=1 Tax=Ketogulonicigenium robustum TaxID=92947 RepID=A0A1W6P2R5_9RHOB|nr:two component sensor histidine kinase [Ketogulonicigenium robustum]
MLQPDELVTVTCLSLGFDGAIFLAVWKDALWDRFVMAAPQPRTPSEAQYSDLELRSGS